jgi:hypothetical protein
MVPLQSIYELGAMASTRKPAGSTAKMAYLKNLDTSLELSPEKARELGQAHDSVGGTRQINPLNQAIAARMQEQGLALVLTTELRRQTVLRLCTINPRTMDEDIAKTLEVLDEHGRKDSGSGGKAPSSAFV